jgi:hypothetical protein
VPLLFRKVKINSVAINDAVVQIITDKVTGKPDLLTLFTTGEKSAGTKKKSGKKWDISVSAVSLKNVRLTYDDPFHGIYLNPTVGKLSLKLDNFSLAERQIYVSVIEMAEVRGGITLEKKSLPEKDPVEKAPAAWEFKLSRADLKASASCCNSLITERGWSFREKAIFRMPASTWLITKYLLKSYCSGNRE